MKKLILPIVSLFLIGCTTTIEHKVDMEENIVFHPSLPQPVTPRKIDMNIIEYEGNSYVSLTIKDSQYLRLYMEDMLRYIKSMNGVVCSYRLDLNEDFCKGKVYDNAHE